MLETSYRTRGVNFACLMGPPARLTREDGIGIHNALCTSLGFEDLSFQYQPGAGEESFAIAMERKEGRAAFKVTIDKGEASAPVRLLIEHIWPPSREHVLEDLDTAAEAVFAQLGDSWTRVLAETRHRGQANVPHSAIPFLSNKILHLSEAECDRLSPLTFVALQYETGEVAAQGDDALATPKRHVSIEVLREDPRCVYLEVMSQWTQAPVVPGGAITIDPQAIRTFESMPSAYIRNSDRYIRETVLPIFGRT